MAIEKRFKVKNLTEIKKFCLDNDIKFLSVFGSFARGEAKKNSDIDLLVKFGKIKSLFELVRIERNLSKVFNRKVDLVTEKSLSKYFREEVKKEMKVIYEK